MSLKEELGVPEAHGLRFVSSRTKGTMGQTEIDVYEEVTPDGKVINRYTITDHTELRGLRNTRSIDKQVVALRAYPNDRSWMRIRLGCNCRMSPSGPISALGRSWPGTWPGTWPIGPSLLVTDLLRGPQTLIQQGLGAELTAIA